MKWFDKGIHSFGHSWFVFVQLAIDKLTPKPMEGPSDPVFFGHFHMPINWQIPWDTEKRMKVIRK